MDDEYWEHLSNPVAVALDHDYSDRHGLDRSIGFPWDDEKGVYFVKAFHQQHCLVSFIFVVPFWLPLHPRWSSSKFWRAFQNLLTSLSRSLVYQESHYANSSTQKGIRKVLTSPEEVKEGKLSGLSLEHNLHCIDTLLQDIMCTADDTLMPSEEIPEAIGDKQIRTCRSWDDLVAWSREPERHACYDIMSDYVPVLHTLEYYAHCPKDSPHYATMKEYFEIHGHKQIFASGPMKFGHGHDD